MTMNKLSNLIDDDEYLIQISEQFCIKHIELFKKFYPIQKDKIINDLKNKVNSYNEVIIKDEIIKPLQISKELIIKDDSIEISMTSKKLNIEDPIFQSSLTSKDEIIKPLPISKEEIMIKNKIIKQLLTNNDEDKELIIKPISKEDNNIKSNNNTITIGKYTILKSDIMAEKSVLGYTQYKCPLCTHKPYTKLFHFVNHKNKCCKTPRHNIKHIEPITNIDKIIKSEVITTTNNNIINKNLDNIYTTVQEINNRYKSKSAYTLGKIGEIDAVNYFSINLPEMRIYRNMTNKQYGCDICVNDVIAVEMKNYTSIVKKKYVNKFIKDISESNFSIGIFISMSQSISNKSLFQMEMISNNKLIIWIPNATYIHALSAIRIANSLNNFITNNKINLSKKNSTIKHLPKIINKHINSIKKIKNTLNNIISNDIDILINTLSILINDITDEFHENI